MFSFFVGHLRWSTTISGMVDLRVWILTKRSLMRSTHRFRYDKTGNEFQLERKLIPRLSEAVGIVTLQQF